MKKIVSGEILKQKMMEAINLLCDTVKCTLGPKGNNVIIDHSSFSPFITNDGVTIAENIESDDEVVNVILELAKEASIKTNQNVGDGTTTTLVILQSLFSKSMDYINKGFSNVILKRELDNFLKEILIMLEKEKINVNDNMKENIAYISSNDKEISKVVGKVFSKVNVKEAISISEVNENRMDVIFYKGYIFQSVLASQLLLECNNGVYKESMFLIVDDVINDLESVSSILNESMSIKKPLVIIAKDFSDYFASNIVSLVMNGELQCLLLKVNEYGIRQRYVEKDLEILSGAKIVNKESEISVHSLGIVKGVYASVDNVRIDFIFDERIEEYVLKMREDLKDIKEEYMVEFYNKRLAMFNDYTASIIIGANTKTELRERRMRLEDAICAVSASNEGVLVGGGLTLLKISRKIKGTNDAEKIWKEALEIPFRQLMINSGLDYNKVICDLEKLDFKSVYNLYTEEFEDIDNTKVIDSYKVVVNFLVNACSIATMLITTNSLVINEHLNNLNKINDYGDI